MPNEHQRNKVGQPTSFEVPKNYDTPQRKENFLPISTLNMKNPGPITSLLQSYKASITCHTFCVLVSFGCYSLKVVRLQSSPDQILRTQALLQRSIHYK